MSVGESLVRQKVKTIKLKPDIPKNIRKGVFCYQFFIILLKQTCPFPVLNKITLIIIGRLLPTLVTKEYAVPVHNCESPFFLTTTDLISLTFFELKTTAFAKGSKVNLYIFSTTFLDSPFDLYKRW